MDILYLTLKLLHIAGFTLAIGVTLAMYVSYDQCWKLYFENRERGLAAFKAVSVLNIPGMIGLLLVLAAGIAMLFLAKFSFAAQSWFQIKLVLILLLLLNGFTWGRSAGVRLQSFVSGKSGSSDQDVTLLKNSMKKFYITQLILFAIVLVLGVFRFG